MQEIKPADEQPIAPADQCGLCLPHCPTCRLADHKAKSPRGRMARIAQLDIPHLPPRPGCCVTAGSDFLPRGARTDRLRAGAQSSIQASGLPVTSNIGCRIFLDNGLRRRPAGHPLTLLAQQLEHPHP